MLPAPSGNETLRETSGTLRLQTSFAYFHAMSYCGRYSFNDPCFAFSEFENFCVALYFANPIAGRWLWKNLATGVVSQESHQLVYPTSLARLCTRTVGSLTLHYHPNIPETDNGQP